MENIQNPENKITTWWKKVLFIFGVYLIWWLVFFGGWFIFPNIYVNSNFFVFKVLDIAYPFLSLVGGPIFSFFIPRYLNKKTDIKLKTLKIINWIILISWLFTFVILILEALSHFGSFL